MQIEIKIDETCREPRLVIYASSVTEELRALVGQLSGARLHTLCGYNGDSLEILEPEDIFRIYTEEKRVFAQTAAGRRLIRLRLYEIEARLEPQTFVRISHSEIINIRKAVSLDLSMNGTICVKLSNGDITYVSRRYIPKIKDILGI